MLLRLCLKLVFNVIDFLFLKVFVNVPSFPVASVASVLSFFSRCLNASLGFLFLFIRPVTFFNACSLLFSIHIIITLYYWIIFVFRKIPFISIR